MEMIDIYLTWMVFYTAFAVCYTIWVVCEMRRVYRRK